MDRANVRSRTFPASGKVRLPLPFISPKKRRIVSFRTCIVFAFLALSMSAAALEADHVVKSESVPVRTRGVSDAMQSSVDEVIVQQLDLSGDSEASPALADDLAFFVRHRYLEQGFEKAGVRWTVSDNLIVLVIDEGTQRKVGEVVFENNPGLDDKELRRYLLRPTKERVGRTAQSLPYVEREIRAGLDLVLRYVLSQGYQDAIVDEPVATEADDGSVSIHVTMHPGEQWHIGDVSLVDAPARLEDEMQSDVTGLKDQVANEARIENTRRQLEGLMQAQGYFAAKVTETATRGKDQHIDIAFTAVPGPLHHVSGLQLDGRFSKGAQRLIRSAFRPALGRTFDSKRMELSYGRVSDTGIFEHLEVEPKQVGDDELALTFAGEEAKPHSVALSGGYDTFLGAILGIEYKNVNLFDSGGLFRVKLIGTQLGLLAGIQWKNPALFGSPYALAIDLMPETFTFEGYSRNTAALRTALSRDFSTHFSAELYLLSSVNSVSSDTLTVLELGPDDYNLEEGGLTLRYEARDNPVSPTRGWFMSATIAEGRSAGGSLNVSYTRTNFAASWYHPLTKKWRVALGAQFASLISGDDVGYIPIELRNYNGGAKGVRSFAERELGPKAEDGTPLGGTQSETISGEVSFEIAKNLEIAGFVDAGSLTTDKGSVLPKFKDMRYAAGLGLRYRLPFGPLRVDYGVNLDRKTGENLGALHIGFGFAF